MDYKKILPQERLKPYIRYFGLLKDDREHRKDTTFKVMADGCPGLIFQLNADSFSDENNNKFPAIFLHGLTTKHSEKTTRGNFLNIIVNFRPNALKTVFNIDAYELKDQYADLDSIIRNDLTEQLLCEKQNDKRIEILSGFIGNQIKKNKCGENARTASLITKMNGETGLSEIRSALKISERSLERIFKTEIGVSPKLFLRIQRFQDSLRDVRLQQFNSLAEVAHKYSYADQSHYIRDFKDFSGTTPSRFLLHTNEQVENFPEWKF